MRIFVSTEDSRDPRVAEVLSLLSRHLGLVIVHSPLNPIHGQDSRWADWYEKGCREAIEIADCFLAIETAGYDSSTWMTIEFETAFKSFQQRGCPDLFFSGLKPSMPAGFADYLKAATCLPPDPEGIEREIVARIVGADRGTK